jgi:hypothetical protein
MKKIVLLLITFLFLITNSQAFDIKLLASNKEAISRELSKDDKSAVAYWKKRHRLTPVELRSRSVRALSLTMNEMERIDTTCDLGLATKLLQEARAQDIVDDRRDSQVFLSYLRSEDLIDDIFLRLLRNTVSLNYKLEVNANNRVIGRPINLHTPYNEDIDIEKFYAAFQKWPDDVNRCSLSSYFDMVSKLKYQTKGDRDGQINKLNHIAYRKKIIDQQTFNKLETFRLENALDWPVYFRRYADVVNNAKDKLTKKIEASTSNTFTSKYIYRRDKVTQRGRLYETYNSTQIILLAQIIEKTAKRMDAVQVTMNWQYNQNSPETEIYVLSPMEQYRAALKMLRKEMAEVMRSSAFQGTNLEYEDLIAAAFETGYIKSEELDHILKFEDFWNPQQPRWRSYTNFVFSLAGTATFYLPPPWNIIGAIGLVLTQSRVNGQPEPDPEDNWNVII